MEIMKRMAAAKLGKLLYYTGKPCKHGHIAARYTSSGSCTQCLSNATQAQRDEIREALKAARNKV